MFFLWAHFTAFLTCVIVILIVDFFLMFCVIFACACTFTCACCRGFYLCRRGLWWCECVDVCDEAREEVYLGVALDKTICGDFVGTDNGGAEHHSEVFGAHLVHGRQERNFVEEPHQIYKWGLLGLLEGAYERGYVVRLHVLLEVPVLNERLCHLAEVHFECTADVVWINVVGVFCVKDNICYEKKSQM